MDDHANATNTGADTASRDTQPVVEPGRPATETSVKPAGWAWSLGVPTAVVLLTLVVFVPALASGFVHWDDDDLLFGTTHYQEFTPESLAWMWSTTFAGHFQPLTWLSYSLDYLWTQHDPFGYHLTNVALHLFNAALFYWLTLRLLRRGLASRAAHGSRALVMSAGVAALVFAIHPLRAESVAWIAERRDVLSGFFYLIAIHCYISFGSVWTPRSDDGPSTALSPERPTGRTFWIVACFLAFVAATLAKASTVMLPLVLLVLDAYPLGRLKRRDHGADAAWPRIILEKVPFLAVSVIVGLLAINAQSASGALYPLNEYGLPLRAAQAFYGSAFYVWKTLLPIGLGPLYPIPDRSVVFGWMLPAGLATFGVLVLVAVMARRRYPVVWVALTVFVIQLLPVVGVFQSGPQFVADRYTYLACMGFAVLAGALCLHLMLKPRLWSDSRLRAGAVLVAACIISWLTHATFRQASYWDSPLALWQRGVQVSPDSSIAHVNLADAYIASGYPAEAVHHYRRGLLLNPRDSIAASHLGRVLARAGEHGPATRMFTLGLSLQPERSADYRRLALSLVATGRAEKAVTVLRNRARRAPHELATIEMLSDLLCTFPEPDIRDGAEAVRWATRLYHVRGKSDIPAMLLLATALAENGQFDRASSTAEKALMLARKNEKYRLIAELERRLELFRAQRQYHFGS